MRRIVLALVLVFAASAQAQLMPAGGMSAGCPNGWAHHADSPRSFSCNDQSAVCNGGYRPSMTANQAAEAAAARRQLVAQGFVIRRESDTNDGMHMIEYDDAAARRIALFLRWTPTQSVLVTCGTAPSSFDAELPTFMSIAGSAR